MGGAMLPPRSPLGTTIASFLQPSYPKRASGFPALQEPWGPGMTPGDRSNAGHPHLGGQATALSPGQGTETQLENRGDN